LAGVVEQLSDHDGGRYNRVVVPASSVRGRRLQHHQSRTRRMNGY